MMLQRTFCCVLLLAGCADRQVDVDDDLPELLPGCMVLTARGHWEDGSSTTLLEEGAPSSPSVCMCMTKEELNEGIWAEDLNELAYAECKRVEALHDFDWTDCQTDYESGEWLSLVIPAVGDAVSLNHTGLDCDAESDESCSITDPNDDGAPLRALVFILLLSLRRRDTGT